MKHLICALATGALLTTPALARQPAWPADQIGKEKSIPLVRTIGIYNFEPDSDRGVYLQDQQRRWYYARVAGPCIGLSYATRIAVDTRFGGSELDRTGSLLVERDSCKIDSLTASNGPPRKPKPAKKG